VDGAILVDTDVFVDYLRGHKAATAFIKAVADRIALSPIVVAELYAGVKGEKEQATLDELASLFPIVPVTLEIGKAAGLFRRDYAKSHGVGLADALLAATAMAVKGEIGTLNVSHYPMVPGLRPPYRRQ
jgi:predicted nucleic acid-binding protein